MLVVLQIGNFFEPLFILFLAMLLIECSSDLTQ